MNRPLTCAKTAFPCKIIIFLKNSIQGLKEDDLIYSYYKHDGENYASFSKPVLANGTVIAMAFGDGHSYEDEKNIKLGFAPEETINWGVWRDGEMYKLNIVKEDNSNGYFAYGEAEILDEVIEVNDNLLYYLNPIWLVEDETVIEMPTPRYGQKIKLDKYRPARRESYNVSLIKGAGKVKSPDFFPSYLVQKDDLYEGEIKIMVDVVPYRCAETDDVQRTYTFKFPKKVKPVEPKPKPVRKNKVSHKDFVNMIRELSYIDNIITGEIENCTALLRYRNEKKWVFETFAIDGEVYITLDKNKGTLNKCWITYTLDEDKKVKVSQRYML